MEGTAIPVNDTSAIKAATSIEPAIGSVKQPTGHWILNGYLDLLLCCGGLVWLLFFLQYFVVDRFGSVIAGNLLAIFVAVSGHTFGETHVAATLLKLFGSEQMRRRYAVQSSYVPMAALFIYISGLVIPGFTAVLLKLYLLWVIQHFIGQTYGIVLVYCHKRNYGLQKIEKNSLALILNSTAAFAIIRQLTYEQWHTDTMLGEHIPFWGPLPPLIYDFALILLQFSTTVFCALILLKFVLHRRTFPFPAMLTMFTMLAALLLPQNASDVLWVYLPALFHGSQYIGLTLSGELKRHESIAITEGPEKPATASSNEPPKQVVLRYFSSLLLVAVALYVMVPAVITLFGYSWQSAFTNLFCVVNLHHFLTDMAIWKSRK